MDDADKIWCLTLDPALEELINGHLERSERGTTNTMPPATAQQIVQQLSSKVLELTQAGRSAVILCGPNVRAAVRKMIEVSVPHAAVLSYNEIVPEISIEAVGLVGMNG